MARTEGNVFVDGFRGLVGGNMVFRKRRSGKVIIAKNRKKSDKPPTEGQLKVQETFTESAIYAQAAMQDPKLKAMYAKAVTGNQSAYNLALRDAAKAPVIKSLNTAGYSGQPGSVIVVRATDDFKVISVKVSIYSQAGILLEEGNAVQSKGLNWTYTATVNNNHIAGTNIKAIAFDTPGNKGSLEVIL